MMVCLLQPQEILVIPRRQQPPQRQLQQRRALKPNIYQRQLLQRRLVQWQVVILMMP